jgi:hypothetical protein
MLSTCLTFFFCFWRSATNHFIIHVLDDEEDHDDDATGGSRKFFSAREYYCFKLQVRKGLFNIILFGARGFQQWAVDMYIKMETMRLDFFSDPKNQKRIRADLYQVSCCSPFPFYITHASPLTHLKIPC